MKFKFYSLFISILLFLSIVSLFFYGFSMIHFFDTLFMYALLMFCIGLLIYLFSDGAFSIMGHSFRRFHYVTAPKRLKDTMADDDLYNQKEVRIRNEKYAFTVPMILTALAGIVISLVFSYLIK